LRLSRLTTTRPALAGRSTLLQDLSYTYDPVGNILSISDAAIATSYANNQEIEPVNAYQYDALYQLCAASGRENTRASRQGPALPVAGSLDSNQYSNYTRQYQYDRGGNLTQMRHVGNSQYTLDLQVSNSSNRAVPQTGFLTPADVDGQFDATGNLQQLVAGQPLRWDGRNQPQQVTQVQRSGADDDEEHYQYDGGGARVRKTTVSQTSGTTRRAQVIYLPGLELRRTLSTQGTTTSTEEELHVLSLGSAGRQQVRLLHWVTGQPADIPNDQLRGSLDNQIGSSLLELDQNADILTQEEYYPFGGTAVWSGKNASETKYKFVRYSGKERDATGLYYYGLRYYAPWLMRWINPDPGGTVDGLNLYRMVRNNSATMRDVDGRGPESGSLKGFSELEEQLKNESPEVQRKTILGMALTNYLSDFGINAKLGGSLVAKLYGAERAPKDIDIDIGNSDGTAISTSKYKTKIKLLENKHISLDVNLVKIESVAEQSGVLHIKYKNAVTEIPQNVDPFDEDEQDKVDTTLFSNAPAHEEVVDIGTFDIFEVAGLVLGSDSDSDSILHVKPELLIAGFLSRMDADKNDSEQSLALIRHLSLKGNSKAEIEAMVLSHVNQKNSNFTKLHGRLKNALSHQGY
jgi:RHS repeat-associated protein